MSAQDTGIKLTSEEARLLAQFRKVKPFDRQLTLMYLDRTVIEDPAHPVKPATPLKLIQGGLN